MPIHNHRLNVVSAHLQREPQSEIKPIERLMGKSCVQDCKAGTYHLHRSGPSLSGDLSLKLSGNTQRHSQFISKRKTHIAGQ